MNQSRGLKRLPRLLVGEPLGRQTTQLIIHQRQKSLGLQGLAALHGRQNAGHLVHRESPLGWATHHVAEVVQELCLPDPMHGHNIGLRASLPTTR